MPIIFISSLLFVMQNCVMHTHLFLDVNDDQTATPSKKVFFYIKILAIRVCPFPPSNNFLFIWKKGEEKRISFSFHKYIILFYFVRISIYFHILHFLIRQFICLSTYIRVLSFTHILTYFHVHPHAHTHSHIHFHIHTHSHTHSHTPSRPLPVLQAESQQSCLPVTMRQLATATRTGNNDKFYIDGVETNNVCDVLFAV